MEGSAGTSWRRVRVPKGVGCWGLTLKGVGSRGLAIKGVGSRGLALKGVGSRGLAIRGLRFRGWALNGMGCRGRILNGVGYQGQWAEIWFIYGMSGKGREKAHCRVHGSVVWCSMGLLLWGELHRWTEPEGRVCVCALWMQHTAWRCRRHCRITARVDMRAAM